MKFYGLTPREIEAVKSFIMNREALDLCKVYKSNSKTITIEFEECYLQVGIDTVLSEYENSLSEYSITDLEKLLREKYNKVFFDDLLENTLEYKVFYDVEKNRPTENIIKAIEELKNILSRIESMIKVKKELNRAGIKLEDIISVPVYGSGGVGSVSISVGAIIVNEYDKRETIDTIEKVYSYLTRKLVDMRDEVKLRQAKIKDKEVIELINKFREE